MKLNWCKSSSSKCLSHNNPTNLVARAAYKARERLRAKASQFVVSVRVRNAMLSLMPYGCQEGSRTIAQVNAKTALIVESRDEKWANEWNSLLDSSGGT